MEKVEIAIRILAIVYVLSIYGVYRAVSSSSDGDTSITMIATIFTMVFSCPCLWALIRWCREYDRRRRMVVVPEKKPKKRPDIALPKDKKDPRTQAQMLEAQRERVKKLENVQEKKLKPKSPKRKGPPTGPRKDTK